MTKDYDEALEQAGMTEENIQAVMAMLGDGEKLSERYSHLIPIFSDIHGIGMASEIPILEGEIICEAVDENGTRKKPSRYINHSNDPNVMFVDMGVAVKLVAKKNINPMEEFTADYRENFKNFSNIKIGE